MLLLADSLLFSLSAQIDAAMGKVSAATIPATPAYFLILDLNAGFAESLCRACAA